MALERPRIGVITTGQGPRHEYDAFHEGVLRAMGIEVEVVSHHVLDGLDTGELRALEPSETAAAVHANVRSVAFDVTTLGPGWRNVWIDRDRFVELVQNALDGFESERLSAAIVCIAEELPAHHLHFGGPLFLPFDHLKLAVESAVGHRRGARVAVFSYGRRQRTQQETAWSREEWMRDLEFQFIELDRGWAEAGAEAARLDPDCALVMGYGAGLVGNEDGLVELRRQVEVPVLMPHMVTCAAVRHLLVPQQDPRQFMGAVSMP